MNPRTIPSRIAIGFVLVVLLLLLVGGIAFWRIAGVNSQVAALASNTVPSVVVLGKISQSNAAASRASRRVLLSDGNALMRASAEAAYSEAKRAGDEACSLYDGALRSDDEDTSRIKAAIDARSDFTKKADTLVELVKAGKTEDAEKWLIDEVDPALEACVAKFNHSIDYNVTLSEKASRGAERIALSGYWVIGTALALASLAGLVVGWSTVRSTRAALDSIDVAIRSGIDKTNRALSGISDSIQEGADLTASSAGQLSSASRSLATSTSEQSASVTEASASLEQISAMIRSTAENAAKAKEFAGQARGAAEVGQQTMEEMKRAMKSIEVSSLDIAKIVKNIDEIAFQTNILALNAAVEAARAGEAGAGFAVVADEVRSLAQRSAAAAKETADKIDAAIANSQHGSRSCGNVGESLEQIVDRIAAADVLVAEIASAAREQAQGIRQVGLAMTQMDKVTQGNAASAEESSSAAEELASQAELLQDNVEQLRMLIAGTSRTEHDAEAPRPMRPSRSTAMRGGQRAMARSASSLRPQPEPRRSAPQIVMPDDDRDAPNFRNF
jgi:methyl-accepting chemotaxis protein